MSRSQLLQRPRIVAPYNAGRIGSNLLDDRVSITFEIVRILTDATIGRAVDPPQSIGVELFGRPTRRSGMTPASLRRPIERLPAVHCTASNSCSTLVNILRSTIPAYPVPCCSGQPRAVRAIADQVAEGA